MRNGVQKILALDTSSVVSAACVTVGSGDSNSTGVEAVAEHETDSTTRHAEDLIPVCERLLAEAGWDSPDAVLVGEGPGPFTGLRVGIAAGQSLAFAWGVDAYGICSLDGLAAQLLAESGLASESDIDAAATDAGPVLTVALDARRRELYWASYARNGARVDGPHVTKPGELPTEYPVGGAGVSVRAEELAEAAIPVLAGTETTPVSASYLARAWHAAGMPANPPVARYLRESDAAVPAAMQGRQR